MVCFLKFIKMNEIFLIVLIICTLITFIQFNKKLGVVIVIPNSIISPQEYISLESGYKEVVCKNNNCCWSATVTEFKNGTLVLSYNQRNASHPNQITSTPDHRVPTYEQTKMKYEFDFIYAYA